MRRKAQEPGIKIQTVRRKKTKGLTLAPLAAAAALLAACNEQPKPKPSEPPKTEVIRTLVERAAEQSIPAPSLTALDFEAPCGFDQLDLRRDALIAKARELGGNAVEGLRANDRERRIAVSLPGSAVAAFRAYAGVAPATGAIDAKESFDVNLKAP